MIPQRNHHFAWLLSLRAPFGVRGLRLLGGLSAVISLAGCSLLGPLDEEGTDTVPVPGDESVAAYDEELWEGGNPSESSEGLDTQEASSTQSAGTVVPVTKDTALGLHTFRTKPASSADAWGAPRVPLGEVPDGRVHSGSGGTGSGVEVPVPPTAGPDLVESRPLLTLKEFREKVFAVQMAEESQRFREAVSSGGGKVPTSGDAALGDDALANAVSEKAGVSVPAPEAGITGEANVRKAEPVAAAEALDEGTPKIKAAYQVFRWNLMETLAGAERAYWRLHFADRQAEVVEKSVGMLAGINDKARIGVLRKTRVPADIVATETLRAQREGALPESGAMCTAAMSELASYYKAPGSGTATVQGLVRTEDPSFPVPPSDLADLVARAREAHPLYLAERMRAEVPGSLETPVVDAEMAALDARLNERIGGTLERLRTAHAAIAKTRGEAENLALGTEEKLSQFSGGKMGLEAITHFEKDLLAARQAHIGAMWDYQNALLDLELEVGDFLRIRGQEVPLATLLSR